MKTILEWLRYLWWIFLIAALVPFILWADAQDQAAHKGCRKLEGQFGGKYGYVWDCPATPVR